MWEQVGQSRSKERKIKEREGTDGGRCSPCILPFQASEESSKLCVKAVREEKKKNPTAAFLSSQSLCDTLEPEKQASLF